MTDIQRERFLAAAGTGWRDLLHDPDAAVRRTALLSASRDADDAELEAVVGEALGDPSPLVRREAAEVAGRRSGIARAHLGRITEVLRSDPEAPCREAAAFALGESGDPDVATDLVAVLDAETSPLVREAVAASLGAIGRDDTLSHVIAMTRNEKPAVRRRAVVALAGFDDPAAETATEAALEDRDRFVREAAEWLLRDD